MNIGDNNLQVICDEEEKQETLKWSDVLLLNTATELNSFSQIGETILSVNNQKDLCPFAINNKCRYNNTCKYVHGDMCKKCGKYILHPFRLQERNCHLNECREIENANDTTLQEDIECGICFERILSTPDARFGLMSIDFSFTGK